MRAKSFFKKEVISMADSCLIRYRHMKFIELSISYKYLNEY